MPQRLDYQPKTDKSIRVFPRICHTMLCRSLATLKELENCDVILGNLRIILLEKTKKKDFVRLSFPNLRECNCGALPQTPTLKYFNASSPLTGSVEALLISYDKLLMIKYDVQKTLKFSGQMNLSQALHFFLVLLLRALRSQSTDLQNSSRSRDSTSEINRNRNRAQNYLFPEYSFGASKENMQRITEHLIVFRVRGLESLGQLFPNLARIRGEQLFDNYALVVHDMPNLREVGLYSLLKIDRGGVIVWASPTICFADTIDWKTIAPKTRHVLGPPGRGLTCTTTCTCSSNLYANYCWNNWIYKYTGRKGKVNEKYCFALSSCGALWKNGNASVFYRVQIANNVTKSVLDVEKTDGKLCSICRHYTYHEYCVSKCPDDTVLLEDNNYCLEKEYCRSLGRWEWNNTCIDKCPPDYIKVNRDGVDTCESCKDCDKTCEGRHYISKLEVLQTMERCVYINGSLIIHIRLLPEAMEELRKYLARVEEISDFMFIYDSMTITSLDFLPSLKRIKGRVLKDGMYSLIINDMLNLQNLFTYNVTKNLIIDNGTLSAYNNPMLCAEGLEVLSERFPIKPNSISIPPGKNGYSGNCAAVEVNLRITLINETSAVVTFTPVVGKNLTYSVLYVRLTHNITTFVVPESCSDSEWYVVLAPEDVIGEVNVELKSLRPASTYGLCIESYDHSTKHRIIARSSVANFTTLIGRPARPFITELVAPSAEAVVIRWVNHKDYKIHITHYQLDVKVIDIEEKDAEAKNHCMNIENLQMSEHDYSLHAVASRPPMEYDTACESMCGLLSTATIGAMVEEHFDFCSASGLDCDTSEADPPENETFRGYVKSVYFDSIPDGKTNSYEVGGLLPYRDYRFRLRACVDDVCSTSARRIVRTLAMKGADRVPNFSVLHYGDEGLYVQWEAPILPNGLVLAYTVQVKTKQSKSELGSRLPQVWCVGSSVRYIYINPEKSSVYSIRVCTATLASISACTDWTQVFVSPSKYWWWGGAILGVILCVLSSAISWKKYNVEDNIRLIENIETVDETEPPIFLSYSAPCIHYIPLNDPY
ncbi:Insulin receptor-related protein [Eumeta japonica]|uniref:Insulin receptor-related protein n=1 Tax=Eumeta variegata TaxID=151549 RepID=A0A4C1YJQ1_EUMVA|nr:Insulin receptor-related protein [Eumeta japonica]